MKRFARLYADLDESNRTTEKIAALERYFREAPPIDAAWGLYFLSGRKLKRSIKSSVLWRSALEVSGLPEWLLSECHAAVGDFSETLALVMPDYSTDAASASSGVSDIVASSTAPSSTAPSSTATVDAPAELSSGEFAPAPSTDLALHEIVRRYIQPLPSLGEEAAAVLLREAWSRLNIRERYVYHKLLSVNFRVGVQRRLVARALANVANIDAAIMEHRLLGDYTPTAAAFEAIISAAGPQDDAARPYPFCLATQLESPPPAETDASTWQVEWKWDGIRAQLIRRAGRILVWSRGEELITDQFPELETIANALSRDVVLDGEVLAWEEPPIHTGPLPFAVLQTRLNRKRVESGLFDRTDLVFMAYDLLEIDGADCRATPLRERRVMLESLMPDMQHVPLRLSPVVRAATWGEIAASREQATQMGAEGVMLKPFHSPYNVGRVRGDLLGDPARAGWWKWKIDPLSLDAVLIGAQLGSGKRASLYTDYTFGLWSDGKLLPFAKAYSGLTDDEIARVDSFVRRHTLKKMGPVCAVKPSLVFEIAFEAIRESNRHKSGIAVRFPRIARWRDDKRAEDADTLESARALLNVRYGSMSPTKPTKKRSNSSSGAGSRTRSNRGKPADQDDGPMLFTGRGP